MADLDLFEKVIDCEYQNERYSVRDNGAVYRFQKDLGKKPRQYDNYWTFGKLNANKEYLVISSASVHCIVATAFHGKKPSLDHVIDHIDTNKQNNRPSNLRWVTRLENIVDNPTTAKKIASIYGSVDNFLSNPKQYSKFPSIGVLSKLEIELELIPSLTKRALQKHWKTPSEFPCCPQDTYSSKIADYSKNLKVGEVFSFNKYSSSIIEEFVESTDQTFLLVMCKNSVPNAINPYTIAKVTNNGFNHFIHENLGSFRTKDGALKYFTINQGLIWTGGDTMDDYC
jgi:hypothetical protein